MDESVLSRGGLFAVPTLVFYPPPPGEGAYRRVLQRRHVDDEAVFDVAFQHAFVGGVDVCHVDEFNVGGDVVFAAEIQQFLCFRDAADERTGDGAALHDERHGVERRFGLPDQADEDQRAVQL